MNQQERNRLQALIAAGQPIIWIISHDEATLMKEFEGQKWGARILVYLSSLGMKEIGKAKVEDPEKPGAANNAGTLRLALSQFARFKSPTYLMLLDSHLIPQQEAQNVMRELKETLLLQPNRKGVIFVSPINDVPVELANLTYVMQDSLPDLSSLEELARQETGVNETEARRFAAALSGLSKTQSRTILNQLEAAKELKPERLAAEKSKQLGGSSILEWLTPDVKMSDVGGLDLLKRWVETRSHAWNPDSKLPIPRGILLCGPSGAGKSMIAKAIASEWGLALLRLDFGRIYGELLGKSEANIRRALAVIDRASPAVVWIDEFEKAISGIGASDRTDGGSSARVVSTFLTWMQERSSNAFLIGTVNDVSRIRPELMRRRRWDEIFWLDLPNLEERRDIWVRLLHRYRYENIQVTDEMLENSCGLSGAEIEQAVVNALYESYHADAPLTSAWLLREVQEMEPQARHLNVNWELMRQSFRPASSGKRVKMDLAGRGAASKVDF